MARIHLSPILPPQYKTQPGRPKNARKRAADEPHNPFKINRKGTTIKCGNCESFGHNARACKGPINPNRKICKKKKSQATTNDPTIIANTHTVIHSYCDKHLPLM